MFQWDKVDKGPSSTKSKEKNLNLVMEPWANRKHAILSKFTTSEKLSIVTSFLSGGEKGIFKS